MTWNGVIRQTHRWVSVIFTVTVLLNIVVMSVRPGQPPALVTYSPLPPLALLLLTGLYLFALPYTRAGGRLRVNPAPGVVNR